MLTQVKNNKQKQKAIKEGNQILTASDVAVKYPDFYKKAMQEKRIKEGLPFAKYNDSFNKIAYHIDKMFTLLDDLDDFFVHTLKAKANGFIKELESLNTKTFPLKDESQLQFFEIIKEQEQLFDLITNTHNIYYQDLLEILTEYNKTRNKESVIKSILDSQYALFKDFEIPEIVRKQVLRIEKNADSFTVLHLSEVVTREKVLNLPKLNPKTLDVLDKMFKNAQIKW